MRGWLDKYFSAVVRYLGVNLPMRGILEVVGDGVVASDEVLEDGTKVTRLTIEGGGAVAGQTFTSTGTGTLNDLLTVIGGLTAAGFNFLGESSKTVTGFTDGAESRRLIVLAKGAGTLTLAHESSSSTAENRIVTPTGADVVIANGGGAELFYDDINSRWVLLGLWSTLPGASADGRVTTIDEHKSISTSNATQTVAFASDVLADEAIHAFDVTVTALKSDGSAGACYKRHYAGRINGGAWTAIASVSDDKTEEDSSAWDCTVDVADSFGENIFRVLVTGAASTTIRWGVAVRTQTTVP